ncbi:MAG: hypothetical protein J6C09_04030 [Clostridia bacterium]|nr:hypothetical protein [Clostridia bacterium]
MNYVHWQRPKTTRRYIHPPMSERMYTLWREGKFIFGEAEKAVRNEYFELVSAGLTFLRGEASELFDFKSAKIFHREDGIPVHGLGFKLGACDFTVEACAPFGLTPACYIKATLKNNTDKEASEVLGFTVRTGLESVLVIESPDVYASYAPDLSVWERVKATWAEKDGVLTDGERFITISGDFGFKFDKERGIGKSRVTLAAGEEKTVYLAFDCGKPAVPDYEAARAECIKSWQGELQRINKLPEGLKAQPRHRKTVEQLTVQLLQCFCRPKGCDFVLARQGGLQRQVWTYETMPVLEALSRIGDFDDYIEPVIDVYFNEFATESGEIVPLAIPWAMATGNVLQSFGRYAVHKGDKEFFNKYRDKAYAAFKWMKELRASVKAEKTVVPGLFPPLRSCDDELVFQAWCSTDTFNIRGLTAFAEACQRFGDGAYGEVYAECEDYRATIQRLWDSFKAAQTEGDLKIPFSPGVPDEVIMKAYHFSYPISYFVEGMDLPIEEGERIFETYKKIGMIRGDGVLTDRMPDKASDIKESGSTRFNLDENGRCVVWYVCCHEYHWFKYFMRHGRLDMCERLLRGVYDYAMTDEYYMLERYNERDPYFAPWSPNASANGRTICMLLDFYK